MSSHSLSSVLASIFFTWVSENVFVRTHFSPDSYACCHQVTPILQSGYRQPLTEPDIRRVRASLPYWQSLSCSNACSDFERQADQRRLMRSLYRCCRHGIWKGAALAFGRLVVLLVLPLLLEQLLLFLGQHHRPAQEGLLIAFAMLMLSCTKTLLENHYYIVMQRAGIRARGILVCLIFKKAMQLSPKARNSQPTGKILNLMQLDAQRFYGELSIIDATCKKNDSLTLLLAT